MELLHNLAIGFSVAFSVENVLYCFAGAFLGTLVGVLPGIGPLTTIAILLPVTFGLPATGALIMLSGIYYGAYHAGSTTAIMLNLPGEPASVVICLDGHPMARQGRAGSALCIAAFSSFFAGSIAALLLATFSPPLANFALEFGAVETTSMVLLALIATSVFSGQSMLTSIGASLVGLLLGSVGMDVVTNESRFTFGILGLADGIDFVALAVGLFALGEIISSLQSDEHKGENGANILRLLPTREDLKRSIMPTLRGTALGSLLGIVPGTGPLVSSFASYSIERTISRRKDEFGRGAVEGVAGPEASQNAAAITHFIPMLTLGIPAGPAMALILGALNMQGVQPGPSIMKDHAELFWGVVASMWIGNIMLLALNLPLVGIWIRLLMMPYRYIFPGILVFCCLGVYSLAHDETAVFVVAAAGLFGYLLSKLECAPTPLLFGFILGPILEENFRRALLISNGSLTEFVTHPISLFFLILSVALVVGFHTSFLRRAAVDAETAS